MNDALLIQACFSANPHSEYGALTGIFSDMLRLCYPRHSAYTRAHKMDYWHVMGDVHPEYTRGAWSKVWLIKYALEAGYETIAYLDTDAVVWNMACDLRDALPADKHIGAVLHDPAKSPYLQRFNVQAHYNVGVLYVRNRTGVLDFFNAWLATFPGDPRWQEQGSFNELVGQHQYFDLFTRIDDTWNATVNVNMIEKPNVYAWHGIMPPQRRLDLMKAAMADDHLRFR